MGEDGGVVLSVDMNISDAEKQIAKLKKQYFDLADDISKKKYAKSVLEKQLDDANAKLEIIKSNLASGNLTPIQQVAAQGAFQKTEAEAARLRAEIEKYDEAIRNGNLQLDATANRIGELTAKTAQVAKNTERTSDGLGETSESAENAAESIDEAAESSNAMGDAIDRAGAYMERFTNRVKRLISRVFVFTLITSALRSMRTWMWNVIKTNDEATAAIAKLKGALLTLAQPLVNVLIPAFITLVNVLARLVATIASLMSKLFGTTIEASAEAAENLYNEQNALEGVGGAAKKASKSLASFDKINSLSGSSDSGAGGGASADAGIVPDFSWMDDISGKLADISKWVLLIGAGLALWKIGKSLPDGLSDIFTKIGGIAIAIGGALILWDGLKDAWENGVTWGNLAEMIGGLTAMAFGLYLAFGPVAAGISLVVGGIALLVTAFKDAMDNGWNLQNTLLAIAGIVATGLGFFFITNSVIPLVIAGIAALLLALTVATGHGEELIEGIKNVIEGFKDFFVGVFTGDIEKAVAGLGKIFEGLKQIVSAVMAGLRDAFDAFLTWLDEKTNGKLHGIIEAVREIFQSMFENVENTLHNLLESVKQILTGIVEFISGVFTLDFDKAWEGIKDIFKGVWNGVLSIFEGAINSIIAAFNWLVSRLNNLLDFEVPDWVPELGGKSIGIKFPTIEEVTIPRLAQGAVIPPNREFMAVLGDQKSGYNIETPLATMVQAFRQALSEGGYSGNNGDMTIIMEVDGQQFAKAVYKANSRESRRIGVSLVEA